MMLDELATEFKRCTGWQATAGNRELRATRAAQEAYEEHLIRKAQPIVRVASTDEGTEAPPTFKGHPVVVVADPDLRRTHPLAQFAGSLAKEPLYDEWQKAVIERRKALD